MYETDSKLTSVVNIKMFKVSCSNDAGSANPSHTVSVEPGARKDKILGMAYSNQRPKIKISPAFARALI